MTEHRPSLNQALDCKTFQSYYYLKEELKQFCRDEGLQTTGGKEELTERIVEYLDTGIKQTGKHAARSTAEICDISEDSIIEDNFVCTEKHREFFEQCIGKSFSFVVLFQKWLKANAGKTYRDAVQAYRQIIVDKKHSKTDIGKQFEYNSYIRDFFAANKNASLGDAIKCWKYKKSIQGHNKYEESDLQALTNLLE